MAKEWFTALEISDLQGTPNNARNIRLKASKENWQKRKCSVGKGYEYHISSLPQVTQQFLAKQAAQTLVETNIAPILSARQLAAELTRQAVVDKEQKQAVKEQGVVDFNCLPKKSQTRAEAKLLIMKAYEAYIVPHKAVGKEVDGLNQFLIEYKTRSLELPQWIYSAVKTISKNFKYRWKSHLDNGGLSALAGNYTSTRGKSVISQQDEVEQFLMGFLCKMPHLASKPKAIHQSLVVMQQTDYPHWEIPSISSVQRWVNTWVKKHSAEFAFVTNPDAYNSSHRPLYGTAYMHQRLAAPNDIWEFDSTPADVMLKDGRHSIIAVIDVFTRRVKLWVAKTSNSEGICLLLRKTILDWGMLNEDGLAVTDNGSDYVSKRVGALFDMLENNQHRTKAYSGWEKPFVERFFRTLSHSIVEKLPSYIGHNVSDRKQIEAAKSFAERISKKETRDDKKVEELKLTSTELQQFFDEWMEYNYHHSVHSELGDTPFNVYQQSAYQPRMITNPDALNLLLNFIGEATVIRGIVKAGSVKYTAPELMEAVWDRKKVRVFIDPSDVGRAVLYPLDAIGENTDWIEAVNQELIGNEISPQAFAERRKAERKVLSKFRKSAKEYAEIFGIDDIHAKELAYHKAQNSSLAAFPKPSLPNENGMLSALDDYKPISALGNDNAKPNYSEAELAAIAERREQRSRQQAMTAENNAKLTRSELEIAWEHARKSVHTPLTEKENKWFKDYLRSHVMAARRINKFLEEARHQQDSNLTGDAQ
jgi:putative transposase